MFCFQCSIAKAFPLDISRPEIVEIHRIPFPGNNGWIPQLLRDLEYS